MHQNKVQNGQQRSFKILASR